MFRTLRRKVFRLALVSGAGAAATYFFDRDRGPQRREEAKQKADSLLKRSSANAPWQPERAADVFDAPAPVTTPPITTPPASVPVTPPTIGDIIATPEREIDPLSTRP